METDDENLGDNLPLNPERREVPQGIDNVDFSQSSDAPTDRGESSQPAKGYDVENAGLPLISVGAQPEEIQDAKRDSSIHSERDDSSEVSYSDSEYSVEPGCLQNATSKLPKCFITIKNKFAGWFKRFKKWSKPYVETCKNVFKVVAKLGLIIMTFIGIGLLTFDQYTDGKTAVTICSMDCTCVWNNNPENITTEEFKKYGGICEGAGDSKQNKTCHDAFGNEDLIARYCNPVPNATECNRIDGWRPNGWYRHPRFCSVSWGTILGSSIITSTFLLYKVSSLYESMLMYLRWDPQKHSFLFQLIGKLIWVFWLLQILPHVWIIFTFFICYEAWNRERKQIVEEEKKHWEETFTRDWEWEDKEEWDQSNRRSKIIFAIFEDTPQLTLHSMFIINSAVKEERVLVFSGLNFLGIKAYIGAITSIASMAIALTLYKQTPDVKSKFFLASASILAVGSRAFICACYASTINEEFSFQTWTLFLPPATSFCLFLVDKLITSIINRLTGNDNPINRKAKKHSDPIYKWNKIQTWDNFKKMMKKIFDTVTSAIVSLVFEGNSIESLIPAYTYLLYAVILDTMWVSETSDITEEVLRTILYLSLASVLYNLVLVQLEGKHKVRCLIYSIVFLISLGVLYHQVEIHFDELKKLYFTNKAVERITENDRPKLIGQTQSSITTMIIISGIISSINLLLKIAGMIRDCFIRALIPDRKQRRKRQEMNTNKGRNIRQGPNSDMEETNF